MDLCTDVRDVKRLLTDVSKITQHFQELSRARGDSFNIFSLLGVDHYEQTHSRILAELLNPEGSHGMGDRFLKAFVDQFNDFINSPKQGCKTFQTKGAIVRTEVSIGTKTDISGGRLDILIQEYPGTRKIIIENKIFAADQVNQIARYHEKHEDAKIFYLNPKGDAPSEASLGIFYEKKEENSVWLQSISYANHITEWLAQCRKEASELPFVRETIAQYNIFIKLITNQNISKEMNKEIVDAVVQDNKLLAAFFALHGARDAIADEILNRNLKLQLETISTDLQLKFEFDLERYISETGFSFSTDKMRARNLRIRFCFDNSYLREFAFGFCYEPRKPVPRDAFLDRLYERFSKFYNTYRTDTSSWWLCFQYLKEWGGMEGSSYKEIRDGRFGKAIEEKVSEMLDIFNSVDSGSVKDI
jgi:hypothetical protein